ncbi:Carboxylesterase 1 [Quillaja saponaria]|uniref:Carboxylesterase 1 n=1 Tax=Quillaja saponaria TaxID=32244 RepID=A0AAD7M556_QUISA|nr:Carboxylesterase 1 [Quillaja saponaria]
MPFDLVSTVDPYQFLQISRNPDGTITRLLQHPSTTASPDLNSPSVILTKDVTLNPNHNTWLRIFLPRQALDKKLPLIVYYHGGGFVLLSASTTPNHDFCSKLATRLSAVIVSVDYRLAPEHLLPAAYDDAVESLHWLKTTQEEWIREFVDYSNCYLMGTSAGGNIAYHAGLRASTTVDGFDPLKIKGLILHHPFFGGTKRTGSELRMLNDLYLPLSGSDLMWELALPAGVDRDHKYCNPMVDVRSDELEEISRLGWRVLLTGCEGDPLIYRQRNLVELLRSRRIHVVAHFQDGFHGLELIDPTQDGPLLTYLKDFLYAYE